MQSLIRSLGVALLLFTLVPAALGQQLRVMMVNQDPDPVLAGEVVEVRFKIENMGEATRDPIEVEIFPEYPLALYESTAVKEIGTLRARQDAVDAAIVDFKLRVDQDAVDGDHELPLALHLGKEGNIMYDDTFFIDVDREQILLRPYIIASDLVTAGSRGKVTIEIANAGGYNVEALELELLPSADYRLLSTSNYVYLGDLDADDTESEDFDIYVGPAVRQVSLPVRLSYEVNDKDYADESTLTLNLLSPEEAVEVGLITKDYTWAIVSLVAVVVIGFFVIRKLRKR